LEIEAAFFFLSGVPLDPGVLAAMGIADFC
jgi:hypothetical protein